MLSAKNIFPGTKALASGQGILRRANSTLLTGGAAKRLSPLHQTNEHFRRIQPALFKRWEVIEVPVPSMGESITEGTIQTFKKQEGELVEADEVVAIIDTDKISVDVNSPVTGVITKLLSSDGETVNVGDNLFVIDTEGTPSATAGADKNVACEAVVDNTQRHEAIKAVPRIRQRIAERLTMAKDTTVMLTTFQECDMSNVMDLRKVLGPKVQDKYSTKLGFMSFFLSASAKAMQKFPAVKSRFEDGKLVTPNYVDISVAVSTPTGLVVPVIKDVEKKSLVELERELLGLATDARNNKLSLESMAGGNFTISNGGIYGSLAGTPIINPPQAAILGMHSITKRPVVKGDQIVIRPIMFLALTYDHKVIDGMEAVSCLKQIKEHLENPKELLGELEALL